MEIHQTAPYLCELLVGGLCSLISILRSTGTYQHQPVGILVCPGVLGDVPTWHPRAHDAKRKHALRNLDDGEHIRMRIELALFAYTTVYLRRSLLSVSR